MKQALKCSVDKLGLQFLRVARCLIGAIPAPPRYRLLSCRLRNVLDSRRKRLWDLCIEQLISRFIITLRSQTRQHNGFTRSRDHAAA